MSLNYNTICCFNSCFQTPQLFWVNFVEPLLQFQLYLPPITCALYFIVMARLKERVFFSSTVLFHQKNLNHHPLEIIPVSCVSSGAITGDGDRKSWDPRATMIWDNFSIFRTNCAILTTSVSAQITHVSWVLAWMLSRCLIKL